MEKNYKKLVGTRIKEFRERAGYSTQEDLARRMDIDQSRISRWESGQQMPTGEHKATLLRLLNKSSEDLFSAQNATTSLNVNNESKVIVEHIDSLKDRIDSLQKSFVQSQAKATVPKTNRDLLIEKIVANLRTFNDEKLGRVHILIERLMKIKGPFPAFITKKQIFKQGG